MTRRPASGASAFVHVPWLRTRWCQALALASVSVLATACSTRPSPATPIASSPTAVVQPTAVPAVTATRRLWPEATATETATPSVTPTAAIAWKAPVVEVHPWPEFVIWMTWTSPVDIELASNPEVVVHVDGQALTVSTATPAPTTTIPDSRVSGTWSGEYVLYCAAGEVWFTEARTDRIVGRTKTGTGVCPEGYSAMTVSPDHTALAYVDFDGTVWVWELGVTEPRRIATTTFAWQEANWSPNSQDLVVMARIPGSADANTYMIAHRDGRPATTTDAELSTRSERTPIWQTDIVLRHYSQCGVTCDAYSFYEASTGRFLTSFGTDGGGPHAPDSPLSPDGRWVITRPDGRHDWLVWDLETLQTFTVTPDPDRAYQQVGWTPDSSTSFMIERATRQCPCDPDDRVPGDLWVLDPVAQTLSPVMTHVLFASLSPSGERLWVVTESDSGGLEGMLIDRSGQRLSAPQDFGLLGDLVAAWDNNAQVRAFGKPFTVTWSPSSQRALIADWQTRLWYVGSSSSLQLLTDAWLTPRTFWEWDAEWSPDETAVIVTSQDRGWLIGPLDGP